MKVSPWSWRWDDCMHGGEEERDHFLNKPEEEEACKWKNKEKKSSV